MRALILSSALLLSGCGTAVVDGITVVKSSYDESLGKVLAQAETDLTCPREQLVTKLLTVSVHADVQRMQVTGCDKNVVYTRKADVFVNEALAEK
jgi:hypothetical protein